MTVQRNWQHRTQKTKTNKTKTQHNMCWTPLYWNKHKQRKQGMSPPTNKGRKRRTEHCISAEILNDITIRNIIPNMDFKYKHELCCTTDYYTTSYNFIEIIILVALSFGLRYIFFSRFRHWIKTNKACLRQRKYRSSSEFEISDICLLRVVSSICENKRYYWYWFQSINSDSIFYWLKI